MQGVTKYCDVISRIREDRTLRPIISWRRLPDPDGHVRSSGRGRGTGAEERVRSGSRETSDVSPASGPNSHEFGYEFSRGFAFLLQTRSRAPRRPVGTPENGVALPPRVGDTIRITTRSISEGLGYDAMCPSLTLFEVALFLCVFR